MFGRAINTRIVLRHRSQSMTCHGRMQRCQFLNITLRRWYPYPSAGSFDFLSHVNSSFTFHHSLTSSFAHFFLNFLLFKKSFYCRNLSNFGCLRPQLSKFAVFSSKFLQSLTNFGCLRSNLSVGSKIVKILVFQVKIGHYFGF